MGGDAPSSSLRVHLLDASAEWFVRSRATLRPKADRLAPPEGVALRWRPSGGGHPPGRSPFSPRRPFSSGRGPAGPYRRRGNTGGIGVSQCGAVQARPTRLCSSPAPRTPAPRDLRAAAPWSNAPSPAQISARHLRSAARGGSPPPQSVRARLHPRILLTSGIPLPHPRVRQGALASCPLRADSSIPCQVATAPRRCGRDRHY